MDLVLAQARPQEPPVVELAASGGGAAFVLVLLVVGLVVAIRLAAGSMDRDRIREYVENRGGKVESVSWEPFGKGWFGEKSDRIYRVAYVDARGRRRGAWCKTSAMSGVYWTDDEPREAPSAAGSGPAPSEAERLREENERLRRELDEARRGRT